MKEVKRWKVTPMSTIDVVSAEDFDSIVKELHEQCRLHGMGAEREAKLMAQKEALERKLKVATDALETAYAHFAHEQYELDEDEEELHHALFDALESIGEGK